MPKVNSGPTILFNGRFPQALIKTIESIEPKWKENKTEVVIQALKSKYYQATSYDERITVLQERIKHRTAQIKVLDMENDIDVKTMAVIKEELEKKVKK